MPVTWSFDDRSTFTIAGAGVVTLSEFEVVVSAILADERLIPGSLLLLDGIGIERVGGTAEEIRHAATLVSEIGTRGVSRVAIVAEKASIWGVARMFSVFASILGVNIMAFRDSNEAREWLAEDVA